MENEESVSVFTAVPTVYAKLLEYYDKETDSSLNEDTIKKACQNIRFVG